MFMAVTFLPRTAVNGTLKLCWSSNATVRRWFSALKKPTLYSNHPECLGNIFLDIRIFHRSQLLRRSCKNNLSIAQDHETGMDVARQCAFHRLHMLRSRIKRLGRQNKSVLQAMAHQQGAGFIYVALLHDQFNNRS